MRSRRLLASAGALGGASTLTLLFCARDLGSFWLLTDGQAVVVAEGSYNQWNSR